MNEIEEKLYEIAGEGLVTKNPNRGIWAKAFAEAEGDEAKTKAKYIELRVESLREKFADEVARQESIAREKAKPIGERVARILSPLKDLSYKETDHIPRERFQGHKSDLSCPIEVERAANYMDLHGFEIIAWIKLGYLKGVYQSGDWYFDLDTV